MSARRAATRLAVAGAAGRMGRRVLEAALDTSGLEIVAAVTLPGEPWVGRDLGTCLGLSPMGIEVAGRLDGAFSGADVVVEFTTPEGLRAILPEVARAGVALVSGTTGLTEEDLGALRALSARVPIVWAPNMSLGANLLMQLVKDVAVRLGPEYDLEILEIHHRHKQDAPSGTALALAEAGLEAQSSLSGATGMPPESLEAQSSRSGAKGEPPEILLRSRGRIGPRKGAGQVGVGVLRGGDVVGDHTVYFLGPGERVELVHRATDRMAFARGAVRAAQWLVGRAPGLYTMRDVLGFD